MNPTEQSLTQRINELAEYIRDLRQTITHVHDRLLGPIPPIPMAPQGKVEAMPSAAVDAAVIIMNGAFHNLSEMREMIHAIDRRI